MNITEANATNTLLRYFLGFRSELERDIDDQDLRDDAETAAALLADRANQALDAGITGDQVHDAWIKLELQPWTDTERPGRRVTDVPLTGGML